MNILSFYCCFLDVDMKYIPLYRYCRKAKGCSKIISHGNGGRLLYLVYLIYSVFAI